MESSELFLTILSQKHVLEKISSYLSANDCYNLARTCKTSFVKIGDMKMEDDILFFGKCYCSLEVNSAAAISVSEIGPVNKKYSEKFNPEDVRKLQVFVDIRLKRLSGEIMKSVGEMLNVILKKYDSIKELILDYSIRKSGRGRIQESIKEIKCDNVSTLKIFLKDRETYEDIYPVITDSGIFKGFTNLKKIRINDMVDKRDGIDAAFIDVISKIQDIIIEFPLKDLVFYGKYTRKERYKHFLLSYITQKSINLALPSIFENEINFNYWLQRLDASKLSLIRLLNIKISSHTTFCDLSRLLKDMRNLETLKMNFTTDRVLINYGVVEELNAHTYESFKNLSNLKTIYIISDFYRPIGEMNREYTIMDYTDDEFKYFPEDTQKIERYKMDFQNEIMAFLSGAPESVRNVYISGLLEITNPITHLLNEYFPSLSCLFLKTIKKIDTECLKNFKNLEIFVSWIGNVIEVPANLKVCLVVDGCGISYYEKSTFESCSRYYRELDQFTKEYTLHGSIDGKVFFRHFHDYDKIKSYFQIIAKLDSDDLFY